MVTPQLSLCRACRVSVTQGSWLVLATACSRTQPGYSFWPNASDPAIPSWGLGISHRTEKDGRTKVPLHSQVWPLRPRSWDHWAPISSGWLRAECKGKHQPLTQHCPTALGQHHYPQQPGKLNPCRGCTASSTPGSLPWDGEAAAAGHQAGQHMGLYLPSTGTSPCELLVGRMELLLSKGDTIPAGQAVPPLSPGCQNSS